MLVVPWETKPRSVPVLSYRQIRFNLQPVCPLPPGTLAKLADSQRVERDCHVPEKKQIANSLYSLPRGQERRQYPHRNR